MGAAHGAESLLVPGVLLLVVVLTLEAVHDFQNLRHKGLVHVWA